MPKRPSSPAGVATRRFAADYLQLVALLHAASRKVSDIFEARLNHPAITARQAMAMLLVSVYPRVNQRGLSELLGMDRSTMSVMLGNMEDAGLIMRTHDPDDTRSWHIELTRRGQGHIQAIRDAEAQTMAIIRSHLGTEIANDLQRTLRQLLE